MTSAGSSADTAAASTTPDELAARMASKLTIDKGKGKERAGLLAPVTKPVLRPTARLRSRKILSFETDVDNLVEDVERKLTLVSTEETSEKSVEQRCADAMRSVNAASKALSGVVESGWKASSRVNTPTIPTSHKTVPSTSDTMALVDRLGNSVRDGLAVLRALRPGDMDVERAASSAVGKLISLEYVSLIYVTWVA